MNEARKKLAEAEAATEAEERKTWKNVEATRRTWEDAVTAWRAAMRQSDKARAAARRARLVRKAEAEAETEANAAWKVLDAKLDVLMDARALVAKVAKAEAEAARSWPATKARAAAEGGLSLSGAKKRARAAQ